ncbi:hypothetical protein JCM11251_006524, partial [Rhodosporidiobolus azoricus]
DHNNDRPCAAILISPLYQPANIRQRPLPSHDLVDVELSCGNFNFRDPLWDPRLLDPPSNIAEQA